MATETQLRVGRRQLMVHDSVAFLALAAITGVLFSVTLLLFRSFSGHRADLALEAGNNGRAALEQHKPHEAIADLRTALSYSPGRRDYELLLAEALGADGHLDEATNYFLNLREVQPGDGYINLQLARLARQRDKDPQQAVDFYRAAIFGDWKGEGDIRRRSIRFELASYLTQLKEPLEAQSELLIAASNARSNPDPALDIRFGDAFLEAGDTTDAIRLYQKAMTDNPRGFIAYEKAGRVAYRQGDFAHAAEWLEHALRESAGNPGSAAEPEGDTATLQKNAERFVLLSPALATTRAERVARELHNRALVKRRYDSCVKQNATNVSALTALQGLSPRWTAAMKAKRMDLLGDRVTETDLNKLIGDTEVLTAEQCGPAAGDDALLLILAKRSALAPTH